MKQLLISFLLIITSQSFAQNIHWGHVINTTYLGRISDMESDKDYNLVVYGDFTGTVDFDPGPGTAIFTTTGTTDSDIFLAKYDSAGNFMWVHRFGIGFLYDEGDRVALDTSGNIFITGMFGNTVDFDPDLVNTASISSSGNNRARFLAKYAPDGDFIEVKHVGGAVGSLPSSQDGQSGLDCDADGNVYMSGFYGTSLTLGPGTTLGVQGLSDIYISKFDPQLNLNWGFRIGSNETEYSQGLFTHADGRTILLGSFRNTVDFDPGPGTVTLTQTSSTQDGFFASYDSAGQFLFVRHLESGTSASPITTLIEPDGHILVAGSCAGTMDADPGPGVSNVGIGFNDQAFLARYDSAGNYQWAFAYGDVNAYNAIRNMGLDSNNNIIIGGNHEPMTDIDPGPDTLTFGNLWGNFVASYDTSGTFRSAFFVEQVRLWVQNEDLFLSGGFYGLDDFDPGPQQFLLQSDTANASWYLLRMHICDNFAQSPGTISVPSLCAGDTAIFSVGQGGPSYTWDLSPGLTPIGPVNGSSITVVVDTAAIQETLLVSSEGGCQNSPFVVAILNINQPVDPLITQSNDTLFSTTGFISYQWYLNDTLIVSATDSTFIPLVSGLYSVSTTDTNGCTSVSVQYNYILSGVNEYNSINPQVWYDGISQALIIKTPDESGAYAVQVLDILGRVNYQSESLVGNQELHITNLKPGIFFIKILEEKQWSLTKLVIQ